MSLRPFQLRRRFDESGFSLLEVMIALALGLLLSIGILSLFSSTSSTNKLQDGLARLQENGRFAVSRMEKDLRMMGGQYCSNTAGGHTPGANIPVMPARVPMSYAKSLTVGDQSGWPDMPDKNHKSFDANGNPDVNAATVAYPISSRWFIQGYSGAGVPGGSALPEAALADGKRVPGSDVLTIRYLRGSGWPLKAGVACTTTEDAPLSAGTVIQFETLVGDDPSSRMKMPASGVEGLALISDCISPAVIPISNVAGNKVTVGDILSGATGSICNTGGVRDTRIYNFSDDFVTVTYFLKFKEDENPGARANSAAGRLIPVLVRRENGEDQELVRGVDQLAFRYGTLDDSGNIRFLLAEEIDALGTSGCTQQPVGVGALENGCRWRSVRSIEARLLVNTVDEVHGLDQSSRTFRFNGAESTLNDDDTLESGLKAGSQLRREFIAHISGRNLNL